MVRTLVQGVVAVVFIISFSILRGGAEEGAEAVPAQSEREMTKRVLNAPSGVFDIETVDGRITRLKVKGEAEAPTSMKGNRADRYAREKAIREAKAAFAKFLGENIIFIELAGEGVFIREKDGKENSQVVDASARLYASHSSAMLKGLIVIVDRLAGRDDQRSCTVVMGWSEKLVNAADDARAEMIGGPAKEDERAAVKDEDRSARTPLGNVDTVTRVGNLVDF